MRVRVTFGTRKGEVVDLAPREARAMLDDGRAVVPDVAWGGAEPAVTVSVDRVASRSDRGMPRGKRRAVR